MTTATRQAIRSVWIVTVGSLYEGGYVESVHETREGAMLVDVDFITPKQWGVKP